MTFRNDLYVFSAEQLVKKLMGGTYYRLETGYRHEYGSSKHLPITDAEQQFALVHEHKHYITKNNIPGEYFYQVLALLEPSIQLKFLIEELPDLQLSVNDLKLALENLHQEKDRLSLYQRYKSKVVANNPSYPQENASWDDVLQTLPVAYRYNLATEILQIQAGKVNAEELVEALAPSERYEFYKTHIQARVKELATWAFCRLIWLFREDEKLKLLTDYEKKIQTAEDFDRVLEQIIVLDDGLYGISRNEKKREAPLTQTSFQALKDFIFLKKDLVTSGDYLAKISKRLNKIGFTSDDIYEAIVNVFDKAIHKARDLYDVIHDLKLAKINNPADEYCLTSQHCFDLVVKHIDKLKVKADASVIIDVISLAIGNLNLNNQRLNYLEARSWVVRQLIGVDVIVTDQHTLEKCVESIFPSHEIPQLVQQHEDMIYSIYTLIEIAERLPQTEKSPFIQRNVTHCMMDYYGYQRLLVYLAKIDTTFMLKIAIEQAQLITFPWQLEQVLKLFINDEEKQKISASAEGIIKSKEDLLNMLDTVTKPLHQLKLIKAKKDFLTSTQDVMDVLIKIERAHRHVVLIALKDKIDTNELANILSLTIPVEHHKQCQDAMQTEKTQAADEISMMNTLAR